ncbi:MAG: hypothetical protein ACI37R_07845 [Candidatus Avigastranaerophilus sp.]
MSITKSFNSKSNISHSIVKSKEFNDVIMNNIGDLISDKELSTSISYKGNNRNLYYAIGKADIINLKIDNSFNITGDLIDTTDYNAGDNRPIVKAAEKLQKSGIIEPRFLVVNFSIPLIAILFSNFKIKNTKKGNEN